MIGHYSIYSANFVKLAESKQLTDTQKVERIIKACADYENVHTDVLTGRWRKREIVEVRQIAMDMAHRNTGLSLLGLGRDFFNRDHSTVIHARDTVDDLFHHNRDFREKYLVIQRQVEQKFKLTKKRTF